MKKALVMMILTVLVLAPAAFAADDYWAHTTHKLGRGIANIATGWVELPMKIWQTSQDENIALGLTLGTLKGVGYTALRTGAGVIDTATFLFPLYDEPLITPEYVFHESS